MHVSFIPYGKRELVEKLLRDMEAQKHFLPMSKGEEKGGIWIDSQVRVMPFGIIEYVFPKEDKDAVLNTLGFNIEVPYNLGAKAKILRTLLGYKKAPKFSTGKRYLWKREFVSIIPIGVRYDTEIEGIAELDKGFIHEAI